MQDVHKLIEDTALSTTKRKKATLDTPLTRLSIAEDLIMFNMQ